jgi:outer membrane protein OmpA-like peptidoglycan-associated protein
MRDRHSKRSPSPGLHPPRVLQRKCACGNRAGADGECPACAAKSAALQRKSASQGGTDEIPAIVDEVLRAPGQPLDATTRAYMEPRFGHDFSRVHVHSDARAAESARAVDAQAYAVGDDLVFGAGQFAPNSASGRKLLAHELAHVAQPQASGSAALSQPGDASEREADRAADVVAGGGSMRPSMAGAAIQRQPLPGSKDLPPLSGGGDLLDKASPLLAAAAGSTTLDDFDTGKTDLKPAHLKQLAGTARNMQTLMREYTMSTVTVTGHADTVDTEAKNLKLGDARAAAVKQALIDLGIPESIISTDSKGEGAPQAVKTKDETPNARNRRVEVHFHPKRSGLAPMLPQLKFPTPGKGSSSDQYDAPEKPPIDFNYHPKIEPDDPTRLPPDIWKPIPPAPKGSGPKSPLDVIGEKILDPIIDGVAGGLSKPMRDKIKEGARAAVKSGVAKGARAAAEAAGLKDPKGLDAIEKAAEAAIQEKGKSSP